MEQKNAIILISIFLIFNIVLISGQTEPKIYYKINLKYDNDNISVNSMDISFSNKEIKYGLGSYHISVLDSNKKVINITLFDIPNKILVDNQGDNGEINSGGEVKLNKMDFDLYIPYNENAKELVIYDKNLKELDRKEVGMYSKNNIINNESVKINEKNKISNENNINKIDIIKNYWLLLIILIISVIIIIYILKRKNKKQR